MEPQTELERLIAEQKADDTYSVKSEFRNTIPLEDIDSLLGMEPDGEIVSFERHPKGSVLVGTASWHGTSGGYTRNGCRCPACTQANTDDWRARYAKNRDEINRKRRERRKKGTA